MLDDGRREPLRRLVHDQQRWVRDQRAPHREHLLLAPRDQPHLAALGWATMMVLGVAYRMLPMVFPSKMPGAQSIFASAALLEIGVLGLFAALLIRSSMALAFGIVIVAALIAFATRVVWMRRHRVPKPVGAPRVDFGQLHAAAAAISLLAATVIGMTLLLRPVSPAMLHAAAAYGVFGLIGFLAQMVVGMEARLLPMVTWFWAYAESDYQVAPPSPHVMRDRSLQACVFGAWTAGVPLLAAGVFSSLRTSSPPVRGCCWRAFRSGARQCVRRRARISIECGDATSCGLTRKESDVRDQFHVVVFPSRLGNIRCSGMSLDRRGHHSTDAVSGRGLSPSTLLSSRQSTSVVERRIHD